MNTNHIPTSRQKLFSAKFVAKATTAAATAITAAGFLGAPAPAQAHPMLPLGPPACSQYAFNGAFAIRQDNGWHVAFSATGQFPSTGGLNGGSGTLVHASSDNVNTGNMTGGVDSGGINGRDVNLTILWQGVGRGTYTGTVGDDGLVHRGVYTDANSGNSVKWDSINPLGCADAPPPPAPPAAQTAAARLGVSVTGPTTLPAGQSGTYTVNVSNPGDVSAPVELYASFNGKLQQTGQVSPSGGFNCDVRNYAGGTSSVHCTVGQFGSKATATIVVQGRGSAPGAGGLDVNINSSDPAAQFVQKSQKLTVTIT